MSTASIDPRIRARRIAVRRDEGRRRLRRLIALVAVAAALAGAGLLTRTPLLDVDRIQVVGAAHTPAADILAAAAVKKGDPLTDIDLARARRAVAALPWVATATVTRDWPGTVRIDIEERQAVAMVAAGPDAWVLVDNRGRALEIVSQPPPGLVAIGGVASAPAVGGDLGPSAGDALAAAAALPTDLAAAITAVGPDDDGGLEFALAAGGLVRFGPPTSMALKFSAIRTVFEGVDLACLAVLDVRVPSVPVLTRIGDCG